jgi:transposase
LKDNRGRNKGKEPTNELERLRKKVRELEAREREREVQIAFANRLSLVVRTWIDESEFSLLFC